MKYLKWLLLVPVVIFPYSFWFMYGWLPVGELWLAGFVCALLVLCLGLGGKWNARSLAAANMAVKLIQIPAYVMWFLIGLFLAFVMGPILTLLVDVMTIALSGLVGLAAVLRSKQEGRLTGSQAAVYGVLQFVFIADVISAIILSETTKEVSP